MRGAERERMIESEGAMEGARETYSQQNVGEGEWKKT